MGEIYSLIASARHTVDLTMYELEDTQAEDVLAADAERGVDVRVILNSAYTSSDNDAAFAYLQAHAVHVRWASSRYALTHQKTLVIDTTVSLVMTLNWTSRYYYDTRDVAVIDRSPADIAAIQATFNADYDGAAITPPFGADLVWSPTDAQEKLLSLINGATSSLRIYSEEMGDTTVENALIKAAKRGVDVQVCGENEDGEYDSAYAKLARAGIHISYYSSSTGFYIHGKVIEADYGTSHAKVFVGSENFSSTSLNDNRELGLIISNHAVLSAIASTFAADFRSGKHWS